MGAEIGMLVVETIAKIRRAYFVHGQAIKAICRDLGASRKIVSLMIFTLIAIEPYGTLSSYTFATSCN
jgi:hypothetical protein